VKGSPALSSGRIESNRQIQFIDIVPLDDRKGNVKTGARRLDLDLLEDGFRKSRPIDPLIEEPAKSPG